MGVESLTVRDEGKAAWKRGGLKLVLSSSLDYLGEGKGGTEGEGMGRQTVKMAVRITRQRKRGWKCSAVQGKGLERRFCVAGRCGAGREKSEIRSSPADPPPSCGTFVCSCTSSSKLFVL